MNLEKYRDFTKVVIVDDALGEGEALRKALSKKDISSLFYHIENTRDFPQTPLSGVRLIFLDLILESLATPPVNPDARAKHVLHNLRRFIGKANVYMLVIWTSKIATDPAVNCLREIISSDENVATPVAIVTLNKAKYNVVPNGEVDFEGIQTAIEKELSRLPAFSVFSEGERLAVNGISNTTSSIAGGGNEVELTKLISALSTAQGGSNVSDDQRAKNALLTMQSIFDDEIGREIEGQQFLPMEHLDGLNGLQKSKINKPLIFSPTLVSGSGAIYIVKLLADEKRSILKDIIETPEENIKKFDPTYYIRKQEIIFLDITPICGSAQANGNNYYVTGVLHPLKYKNSATGTKELKIKKDYCYSFEYNFFYKEEIYALSLNLKTFSTDPKYVNEECLRLKLRSNIIIDIQHKLAAYISRPGHPFLR
jgi:hypothetical protein